MKYLIKNRFLVSDTKNLMESSNQQISRCKKHESIWKNLEKNCNVKKSKVVIFPTIKNAQKFLADNCTCDVLVTGSLHLVGAMLSLVDPEMQTYKNRK